ncbi:cell filamentation protein [Rhodococcus sp. KBS0724]|uniref:Fic family protein n=1 Tax=Rhodococcus sp. KBS0724 TaxID=1179674 RepID=UPI00110F1CB2|nr:Fic family protein [Rhodococcus sp. KBS0724]TSD47100.1 cell filamentation protein [Rhodococcus sp. KBS0724]
MTELTDAQRHAVRQTVAAERLEGWQPSGDDLTDLDALAVGTLTCEDYIERHRSAASARAVPRRRRLALPRPYLVTGTTVLRNNFGFQDHTQLRDVEYAATAARLLQAHLQPAPTPRQVDAEYIFGLHGQVFGDVFGWAGQQRIVDITKNGDGFAPVGSISRYLREVEIAVAATDWHRADRGGLAYALATVYVTYNHAHPFREGNGRTGSLLLHQLTSSTGFLLDLSSIDAAEWVAASRDSSPFRRTGAPSPRPLIPLLRRALVDRSDGRMES